MTDQEFEAGLQAVLGEHFQDLTAMNLEKKRRARPDRFWEGLCWAALYLAIAVLALRLK